MALNDYLILWYHGVCYNQNNNLSKISAVTKLTQDCAAGHWRVPSAVGHPRISPLVNSSPFSLNRASQPASSGPGAVHVLPWGCPDTFPTGRRWRVTACNRLQGILCLGLLVTFHSGLNSGEVTLELSTNHTMPVLPRLGTSATFHVTLWSRQQKFSRFIPNVCACNKGKNTTLAYPQVLGWPNPQKILDFGEVRVKRRQFPY